jgi:CRISPR/Cas system-associated endoribonuclease Cas2
MLYLISYDLSDDRSDETLVNQLSTLGARKILCSQWLFAGAPGSSVADIKKVLEPHIRANDSILIAELTQNSGWSNLRLSEDAISALFRQARV